MYSRYQVSYVTYSWVLKQELFYYDWGIDQLHLGSFAFSVQLQDGFSSVLQARFCRKLQFLNWPLRPGSKIESVTVDINVKKSNFVAEISMTTICLKNLFKK